MSNGRDEELNEIIYPTNPAFGNNVTAHDPSIFKDDNGDYYTFGSHFGDQINKFNTVESSRW